MNLHTQQWVTACSSVPGLVYTSHYNVHPLCKNITYNKEFTIYYETKPKPGKKMLTK